MNQSLKNYPVVFIVGPTCTGKTELSVYLSSLFKGKIINADSLQFYKYMDIGTSKPSVDFLKKQDHYLISHIMPPHIYTAGEFYKTARNLLKKFLSNYTCFVVGGSGFYLQALEKGCYPAPVVSSSIRNQLLEEVKIKGLEHLYKELVQKDPDYAQRVHSNDPYRVVRALSIIRGCSQKISDIQKKFKEDSLPYTLLKIGLTASSDTLKKRIQWRVKNMLQQGLLKEVQFLCDQGWENFPPLKSVGYKEALLCLKGKISQEELYDQIVQRTMKLVKKQKTWFKRDSNIRWYDCEVDFEEIGQDLRTRIERV